jgi:hypothetical protein
MSGDGEASSRSGGSVGGHRLASLDATTTPRRCAARGLRLTARWAGSRPWSALRLEQLKVQLDVHDIAERDRTDRRPRPVALLAAEVVDTCRAEREGSGRPEDRPGQR